MSGASALKSEYDDNGFVVVRGLFPKELMARAAAEAEALPERRKELVSVKNIRCRWQDNVFTGDCTFETFDPVIDLGPASRDIALSPVLLEVLGQLYGEGAHLFKDKLIFKPPGVKGYQLHQDWISWPGFPKSFLTVLVPFESADRDNGCTIVYPGYHKNGTLSVEDGRYHELPADTVDERTAVPLLLEPGDVAIFGGFTPHRSDPNTSGRWRRQLYLSYNAESDGGDQRDHHYREFHAWLRTKYAECGKNDIYYE